MNEFNNLFDTLLNEKMNVSIVAGPPKKQKFYADFNPTPEDVAEAQKVLVKFFTDKGAIQFVNDREWVLEDLSRRYDGDTFSFKYFMKGGKTAEVPRWEGSEHTRTVKQFKSPKDAITSIPANPDLAYRGMSLTEWVNIKNTGIVKSKGEYNIGTTQEGYTFFGSTPATADFYAVGFTPFGKAPSRNNPAVIIAAPRALMTNASVTMKNGQPVGNDGEWVVDAIPLSKVTHVWILTPVEAGPGQVDLIVKPDGRIMDGSRSPELAVRYSIKQVK